MQDSLNPIWLVGFSLVFALLPLLIGSLTAFLKISVVLNIFKSGLGVQQVPSAIISMALALALSGVAMQKEIKGSINALQQIDPNHFSGGVTLETLNLLSPIFKPWVDFMKRQCGQRELQVISENLAKEERDNIAVTIAAFILSELKKAFMIGVLVLLPFLLIDLVVANILAGMGMMMVSPTLLSLPLKLILFISADGWLLLGQSLIKSYGDY